MVVVAPGLPSLDKLLVETILSDQFVDLAEIPPAKGSAPVTNKILDGHSLYVVRPTKRLIPDLPTWLQCFSVYSAVLISKYPERATSLLLYQKNIAYLSQRNRWPSWVVYDNSFRSEAADNAKTDWSLIDYMGFILGRSTTKPSYGTAGAQIVTQWTTCKQTVRTHKPGTHRRNDHLLLLTQCTQNAPMHPSV